MEGQISQRLSHFIMEDYPTPPRPLRRIRDGVLESRGFRSLQHIELFGGYSRNSSFSWALGEPTKVPNLTSRNMSKSGVNLAALVFAHFVAALMAGYFTRQLTPFLPAGDFNMLTLSLPASRVGAILGALNVIDISPLRALSIITVEGLDDYSRSSLYQKLNTAVTGGGWWLMAGRFLLRR
ncbi:unnamed protein product [Calypogeia fissa]